MKDNRSASIILVLLVIMATAYGSYNQVQINRSKHELEQCQQKHEEALVDVLEAFKRLEAKEGELQKLLEEVQQQKKHAEERLEKLQKEKTRK